MEKGHLAEELVALLHQRESVTIERNKRLPVVGPADDFREIDVLISGEIAGYPLRIAIECKNYAQRIGVEKIDEFKGKLEDVGIPPQCGIFVTVRGFTRNALRRATTIGIRPLVLSGLTADRLAREVHEAIQSIVYLQAIVRRIFVESDVDETGAADLLVLHDANGQPCGLLWDLIWAKWRDGEIPRTLGEHEISLDLPRDWHWSVGGKTIPNRATATIQVIGLVIMIPGTTERFTLSHAGSGALERAHVHVTFNTDQRQLPVQVVETERDVAQLLAMPIATRLSTRVPLPRLRWNMLYWPPSDRGLSQLAWHTHQLVRRRQFDFSMLSTLSLADIEGTDLSAAWEPISPIHPAADDPDWPYHADVDAE